MSGRSGGNNHGNPHRCTEEQRKTTHPHVLPRSEIVTLTSTLMMVGIVTIPIERRYLGIKVTLIRNAIALITALCVALVIGLLYGEL